MTDAVEDDPVRRVTQAKVLEALGKFQPGVSDLERIYMASGIDPIYGPDVDYNLDYQLLAGQPYANYLTTTGTPIGGTGGGTRDGGISTLPDYTYPSTPDAEDFELDVINLPESTETTRNTDVGSTRSQDFFSPGRLYGDYARDFDFSKFDGKPIDWANTRIAKRLRKEAKEFGDKDFLSEGLEGLSKVDPRKIPGISALLSMGEKGIAALRNLLPRYREDVDAYGQTFKGDMVSAEGLGLYPEDQGGDSSAADRYAALDEAVTNQMVEDALDIDFDALLGEEQESEETPAWIVRARNREKEKRLALAREANEKGGGLGLGGYRYGSRNAPGSAFRVTTPHIGQYVPAYEQVPVLDRAGNVIGTTKQRSGFRLSAENLGSRGFGGIQGRMLPKSSGSWEGDNPFGRDYQPPSPGDPRYADYVAASMGPTDSMLREVERSVARQVPYVQMDDGQGNSYLIDKKTQAVIAGPFPTGDNSVSSIPGIGSMAEGGLAAFAKGDLVENFPRKNGQISGPGTEKSDDIPAMLSDGEFVTNAAALRGIGRMAGASANDRAEQRRLGAREMYKLQRKGMKAAGVG